MVIRIAPNETNHKVVEKQAVWGTNCYVKISLINLKVSAICKVQQYPNAIKFMMANWGLSEKIVHEKIDNKCLKKYEHFKLSTKFWHFQHICG